MIKVQMRLTITSDNQSGTFWMGNPNYVENNSYDRGCDLLSFYADGTVDYWHTRLYLTYSHNHSGKYS